MRDKDTRESPPTKSVAELADRYDDCAREYADRYDLNDDDNEEYNRIVSRVVEHADAGPRDTVLDLGTGTGAVAMELAADAGRVIGRDISDGMIAIARENAAERGIDNARFGRGSFREPNVEEADIVATNLSIHHLDDEAKREAIDAIAALTPRRFVIGAAMFFGDRQPEDPEYDPEIVYPATVGDMVDWVTDAGYSVTEVEKINDYTGVLVAERIPRRVPNAETNTIE